MKRVLYVSELAEAHVLAEACLPREADFLPPAFAGLGADLAVIDATTDALPDARAFHGVIVGGSFGSANDTEPWRLRLLQWLRDLPVVPYFGICGGHQLWAVARGGRVETMPPPRQVGLFDLDLPALPGWGGVAFQMHGDAVVGVPLGAEVWATDARGVQALRYAGHTWTVQFHPEFPLDMAHVAAGYCADPLEHWTEARLVAAVEGGQALLRAWIAGL